MKYGRGGSGLQTGNMLAASAVFRRMFEGGLPQMRQRIAAAAVVGLLVSGVANAQLKSNVQPGPAAKSTIVATPVPAAQPSLESARRINREEAIKLVKEKKAVYVDVRGKDQYDEGHIKGAISIPLSEVVNRIKEIPPKMFIITYCA
jgi:3-mercaptopyruvate sulfurtransferase SseA